MAAAAVVVLLAGCGAIPPLHRSVVVETNSNGIPVHASGKVANHHYTVMRGDTLYSIAFRANVDYHQLARWNGIGTPYVIHPGQVLQLSRPSSMPAEPAQAPVFRTVSSANTSSSEPAPVFRTVPSKSASAAAATTTAVGKAVVAPTSAPAVPTSTVVAVAGQQPVAVPEAADNESPVVARGATRNVGGIQWSWPANGKMLGHFNAGDAIPGINIGGNKGDPVRAAADGVVVYSGNGLVGYGELVIIKHNDDYLSAYGHNSKRLVKEGEHVKAGQVIAKMGSTGAPRNELEFQVRYKGKPVDPLSYLPSR